MTTLLIDDTLVKSIVAFRVAATVTNNNNNNNNIDKAKLIGNKFLPSSSSTNTWHEHKTLGIRTETKRSNVQFIHTLELVLLLLVLFFFFTNYTQLQCIFYWIVKWMKKSWKKNCSFLLLFIIHFLNLIKETDSLARLVKRQFVLKRSQYSIIGH